MCMDINLPIMTTKESNGPNLYPFCGKFNWVEFICAIRPWGKTLTWIVGIYAPYFLIFWKFQKREGFFEKWPWFGNKPFAHKNIPRRGCSALWDFTHFAFLEFCDEFLCEGENIFVSLLIISNDKDEMPGHTWKISDRIFINNYRRKNHFVKREEEVNFLGR